jgi:hypothetical protein
MKSSPVPLGAPAWIFMLNKPGIRHRSHIGHYQIDSIGKTAYLCIQRRREDLGVRRELIGSLKVISKEIMAEVRVMTHISDVEEQALEPLHLRRGYRKETSGFI